MKLFRFRQTSAQNVANLYCGISNMGAVHDKQRVTISVPEVPLKITDFEDSSRRYNSWAEFTESALYGDLDRHYLWEEFCVMHTAHGWWYAFQVQPRVLMVWCYVKCAADIDTELTNIAENNWIQDNIQANVSVTWLNA